jgi:hypothetical protein
VLTVLWDDGGRQFLAMGAGWAITLAPMSTAVMGSSRASQAGMASAAANTSREVAEYSAWRPWAHSPRPCSTARSLPGRPARASPPLRRGGFSPGPRRRQLPAAPQAPTPVVSQAIQSSFVHAMHAGIVAAVIAMLGASLASFVFVRSHVTHARGWNRCVLAQETARRVPSLRNQPQDMRLSCPQARPTVSGVMHPHGLHRLLHPLWFTPVHAALARAVAARPGERALGRRHRPPVAAPGPLRGYGHLPGAGRCQRGRRPSPPRRA